MASFLEKYSPHALHSGNPPFLFFLQKGVVEVPQLLHTLFWDASEAHFLLAFLTEPPALHPLPLIPIRAGSMAPPFPFTPTFLIFSYLRFWCLPPAWAWPTAWPWASRPAITVVEAEFTELVLLPCSSIETLSTGTLSPPDPSTRGGTCPTAAPMAAEVAGKAIRLKAAMFAMFAMFAAAAAVGLTGCCFTAPKGGPGRIASVAGG
mmetsp:Transcript_6553/g.16917  ORF Transcript_6553/g.16917 Transcript_6553/m.16917 type:complete len:206 (+) Transcript_6553:199-816(+)